VTTIRSVVRGCGSALPGRRVTNQELESMVETSHEWIVQRTGIEQRYLASDE
jgi:3-oxoacyl-[acyl-carrier-protein] synthase-3